jgi:chromosome segregation ATPase
MAQNDDMGKKLATISRGWDQDKGRISGLEADLKTTKDKYAEMPQQLSQAKMEAAAAQRLYEGQVAIVDQLRAQVLQMQSELGRAQSQLGAAQTTTSATTSAMMTELQDSQTQNLFLRDKVAEAQTQIAGLEADVRNLERQKMELGAANAALKAENKDLEKNLESTSNSLKEKETQLTTEIITKTQRLPEGLQDKIDILTTQLRQVQTLTVAIQQDMVPVEETSYSKNTTSQYQVSGK